MSAFLFQQFCGHEQMKEAEIDMSTDDLRLGAIQKKINVYLCRRKNDKKMKKSHTVKILQLTLL